MDARHKSFAVHTVRLHVEFLHGQEQPVSFAESEIKKDCSFLLWQRQPFPQFLAICVFLCNTLFLKTTMILVCVPVTT